MKQFEVSKRQHIDKLKRELDTVEERFHKIINENNMVGEDIRSRAMLNMDKALKLEELLAIEKDEHEETKLKLDGKGSQNEKLLADFECAQMEAEDYR